MAKYENKKRSELVKELTRCSALARAIETGSTTRAFPDVYMCHEIAALIEVKKDDKAGPAWTRKISFQEGQYSFLERNAEKGGYSFVAVFYANGVLFSHINDIDKETERPLPRNFLFLNQIKGNGEILLKWIKTFEHKERNQ